MQRPTIDQLKVGTIIRDPYNRFTVTKLHTQPNGTSPRDVVDVRYTKDGETLERTLWASTIAGMMQSGAVTICEQPA